MTSLEVALIGVLGTIVGGVAVRLIMKNQFVSRGECQRAHSQDEKFRRQVLEKLNGQSRMIRALVLNSGMSTEKQSEILNACEDVQVEQQHG